VVGQLSSPGDRESVLAAARELAPALAARAGEGEAERTMPGDLVARAKRAGLFRLALPRSLGGLELDPATIIETVETLSMADGSAGWTVLIGNSTAFFAWLEPAVAREMIGDNPDFASTSVFGPMGRAVPDGDDRFTVSGRWPFNSGCPHSEWLQVGVFVMGEDGSVPRFRDKDIPDWRFAFVRNERAVIEDTWDALGLKGTGSHHLSIPATPVPAEHLAAPLFEPARHSGPLWRLPAFSLAGIFMAGLPLGVARRALDEFAELARSKFRGAPTDAVAEDGHAQVQLARSEAGVQAARAYVYDVVGELWDACRGGDAPRLQQRARLLLAVNQAMRAGVAAVDALFPLAGAGAVFADQPLQRCFRDLHTANQHILFSSNRDKAFAKLQLGIDQPTFMI
jgi:alkylation response protein AidB-like acyl-CoA dehydrogenase